MALSGIQIYKLLPQTNCKDCGLPTCLAFAMKLAAEQVELDKCPHVSDEARETLAGRAAPPAVFDMRGQTVGTQVNVGGDYVDRRSTVIVGDGNVVGDRSNSRVVKRDSSVSAGGTERQEADDVASVRRQLAAAQANLRLIEKRAAEYVLSTDVPLQLVKEQQRLQQRIASLEARLEALDHEMLEGGNLPESFQAQ